MRLPLGAVFPVARAPWVKVEQVAEVQAAQGAASQVRAVAIMVVAALRVVTVVPAVVVEDRLGLVPCPIRPSLAAAQAMEP